MTQPYTWVNKSLSLARQPLLVVGLNYRLFAHSLSYLDAAQNACSMSWLNVT